MSNLGKIMTLRKRAIPNHIILMSRLLEIITFVTYGKMVILLCNIINN